MIDGDFNNHHRLVRSGGALRISDLLFGEMNDGRPKLRLVRYFSFSLFQRIRIVNGALKSSPLHEEACSF